MQKIEALGMIRIIDYKKVDLTDDEYQMYQNICRSYDRPNFKGEDLFRDIFETDDDGFIVFLKPPTKHFTSMEVFLFVCSIMQHQHLRRLEQRVDDAIERMEKLITEKLGNG